MMAVQRFLSWPSSATAAAILPRTTIASNAIAAFGAVRTRMYRRGRPIPGAPGTIAERGLKAEVP